MDMDAITSSTIKIQIGYTHSRKRNAPKIITYLFLMSQLISGFDLGYSKLFQGSVRKCLRTFTLLTACTYNVINFSSIFMYCPLSTISMILMPSFEYILNVIVLLCYKKYSVYDFLCNISEFCELSNKDTYILYLISIIHCVIVYSLKTILMLFLVVNDVKIEPTIDQLPTIYFVFLYLYYIIVDVVTVALIVIFYYIYSSMKHLKLILMSSDQKLSYVLFRYKAIVDTCEKIRPLSNSLVSNTNFSLITNEYPGTINYNPVKR